GLTTVSIITHWKGAREAMRSKVAFVLTGALCLALAGSVAACCRYALEGPWLAAVGSSIGRSGDRHRMPLPGGGPRERSVVPRGPHRGRGPGPSPRPCGRGATARLQHFRRDLHHPGPAGHRHAGGGERPDRPGRPGLRHPRVERGAL